MTPCRAAEIRVRTGSIVWPAHALHQIFSARYNTQKRRRFTTKRKPSTR
jgi:hypothetical protein